MRIFIASTSLGAPFGHDHISLTGTSSRWTVSRNWVESRGGLAFSSLVPPFPQSQEGPSPCSPQVTSMNMVLDKCHLRRHSPMVNSGHTYPGDVVLTSGAEGNGFPPAPFTAGTRTGREGSKLIVQTDTGMNREVRFNPGHVATLFFRIFHWPLTQMSPYENVVFKYVPPTPHAKLIRKSSHVPCGNRHQRSAATVSSRRSTIGGCLQVRACLIHAPEYSQETCSLCGRGIEVKGELSPYLCYSRDGERPTHGPCKA